METFFVVNEHLVQLPFILGPGFLEDEEKIVVITFAKFQFAKEKGFALVILKMYAVLPIHISASTLPKSANSSCLCRPREVENTIFGLLAQGTSVAPSYPS